MEEQKNTHVEKEKKGVESFIMKMKEYIKSAEFAVLLEVKDVIVLGQVNRTFSRIFNKKYIDLVVRLGNLEQKYRYLFWIHKIPYLE